MGPEALKEAVRIAIGNVAVDADLHAPDRASGLVVFAHGSGSSRFSRRNRAVAGALESAGFGTLLLDLLTPDEESVDERTREYRFDIDMLGERVVGAINWTRTRPDLRDLPVALFGASTGAAAALIAAAARPDAVRAVISRGGSARSGGSGTPECPGADVADRRWARRTGDRDEPRRDAADACPRRTRNRAWSDTLVRGARRAGAGHQAGYRLVPASSRRQAVTRGQ